MVHKTRCGIARSLRTRMSAYSLKRIENFGVEICDVGKIAGNKDETVHFGGGRKQSVNRRDRPPGTEATPLFRNQQIDWQYAVGVRRDECGQPSLQGTGLLWIASPRSLDALANFAEYQYAQENIDIVNRCVPSGDITVASLALAHLIMILVSIR